MKKPIRSLLTAVCIAALAGCASPASDTAFKPPEGWRSTPGVLGHFQMWMTGTSQTDRQIVMLVRGDSNMKLEDSQAFSGTGGLHDLKQSTITLCGSQPANYFTGRGEGTGGNAHVPEVIEGVMTSIGNARYAAVYIRPAAVQADAQAETSLHSLCALK
jgi:hypothetical protein